MKKKGRVPRLSSIAILFLAVVPGWSMDITTCGTTVPAGDVGVLQVNLDCNGGPRVCVNGTLTSCETNNDCNDPSPSCASVGVVLGTHATLNLNGHSIVADGQTGYGVWCAQPYKNVACTVYGPGDVTGGVAGVGGGKLTIHDVSMHNVGVAGVFGHDSLKVTNVTVDHGGFQGLYTSGRLRAMNLTANDNGGPGILAETFQGTTVVTNGNAGPGVQVYKSITVTGLTAQNNGDAGVYSYNRGRLVDSLVTGNTYDGATLDILTRSPPRLKNTTCGVSARLPEGAAPEPDGSWGVCTNDGATTTTTTVTTTSTTTTT